MEGLFYRLSGDEIIVSIQTGLKQRPTDVELASFRAIVEAAIPFAHRVSNIAPRTNSTGADYGKWQVRMNVEPTNACPRMAVKLLKQKFVDETRHEE